MLSEMKRYPAIQMLEIGTGGWAGMSHLDMDALLADDDAIRGYRSKIRDAGLQISARRDEALFRKTVLLASAVGMLARVLLTEPPVQAWWA